MSNIFDEPNECWKCGQPTPAYLCDTCIDNRMMPWDERGKWDYVRTWTERATLATERYQWEQQQKEEQNPRLL